MIKAKEVLKDKFWIVEEHGQNVLLQFHGIKKIILLIKKE